MTSQEKTQLNDKFLEKFPLDSLRGMTIDQYTNLNRSDSFCYWIESVTEELGSVWGGSAYKFGIFKYYQKPKEDSSKFMCDGQYAWLSSLGNTASMVFETVRNAVVEIATYASVGDLDSIEKIGVFGPAIKWKIAFLYSNESFIPYFSLNRLRIIGKELGMGDTSKSSVPEIQKFLIGKRGKENAHDFASMLHGIWERYSIGHNAKGGAVWMWKGGTEVFDCDRLMAGDNVSDIISDYSVYGSYEAMRDDYQKARGNTDVSIPDAYWKFIDRVKVGDIVVVFENVSNGQENLHKMYGWGVVTSGLINEVDSNYPLQRTVGWRRILDEPIITNVVKNNLFFHGTSESQAIKIKELLGINGAPSSTQTIAQPMKYQKYIELLEETHNLVLTGAPGTGKTFMAQAIAEEMGAEMKFVQFHPSYDYTDFVEGLRPVDNGNDQMGFERKDGVFKEFCKAAIKNIADSEKSVENLAKELSWQDKLEQFVEDAMENEKKFKTVNGSVFSIADMNGHTILVHNEQNEKTTDVAVKTDEILDLLTQEVELKIVRDIRNHYGRKFGTQPDSYAFVIIKEIRAMKTNLAVAPASKVEKKPFVFIIDEINRGEASKIFGELFYAIDPGYRGKTNVLVQTQYQNLVPESDVFVKGFYVPENVYILATMNDIDRSVESMDFAMRRRFTWKEVTPDDTQDMLDSLSCADEAKGRMNSLNKAIAGTDGLGAAYMVGPSYFLKLKENGGDFEKLWSMNIEPLLKEYLRGFRKSAEALERFRAAYKREDVKVDTPDLFDEEN